jgi:hypothetical protein
MQELLQAALCQHYTMKQPKAEWLTFATENASIFLAITLLIRKFRSLHHMNSNHRTGLYAKKQLLSRKVFAANHQLTNLFLNVKRVACSNQSARSNY